MAEVYCPHHKQSNRSPAMIHFGDNELGRQYICAACSRVRVFNTGEILSFSPADRYGFISGRKGNFFFHVSNLASDFVPEKGMPVSFEVSFLEDGRVQAIRVKQLEGENDEL